MTEGRTDRQTDGRTDKVITIGPPPTSEKCRCRYVFVLCTPFDDGQYLNRNL